MYKNRRIAHASDSSNKQKRNNTTFQVRIIEKKKKTLGIPLIVKKWSGDDAGQSM